MEFANKFKISLLNLDVLNKIQKHILFCKLSYKEPNEIKELLNEKEYSPITKMLNEQTYYNDKNTDCQAYSWKYNDTFYIIFRGTSSLKDAFIDLNISLEKFENNIGVYVHKGFNKQFNSIKDDISYNIDESIKKISVSGHSLGGGIACIAATSFALKYPNKEVSCYTYGCPRPGNFMFKKLFKSNVKKYYRIIMNDDPVTMVPTLYWYKHVCKGINIKDTLQVTYLDDISWFKRWIYICSNINYSDLFEAHHTYIYQDKIKELFNTDDNDYIDGNVKNLQKKDDIIYIVDIVDIIDINDNKTLLKDKDNQILSKDKDNQILSKDKDNQILSKDKDNQILSKDNGI